MTNSKSVNNYGIMMAKPFVITNSTYCLINCIEFVIYTIAPYTLPFFQAVPRDMRNEVKTMEFHVCDGQCQSPTSQRTSKVVDG